jgi:hypothetical protein
MLYVHDINDKFTIIGRLLRTTEMSGNIIEKNGEKPRRYDGLVPPSYSLVMETFFWQVRAK